VFFFFSLSIFASRFQQMVQRVVKEKEQVLRQLEDTKVSAIFAIIFFPPCCFRRCLLFPCLRLLLRRCHRRRLHFVLLSSSSSSSLTFFTFFLKRAAATARAAVEGVRQEFEEQVRKLNDDNVQLADLVRSLRLQQSGQPQSEAAAPAPAPAAAPAAAAPVKEEEERLKAAENLESASVAPGMASDKAASAAPAAELASPKGPPAALSTLTASRSVVVSVDDFEDGNDEPFDNVPELPEFATLGEVAAVPGVFSRSGSHGMTTILRDETLLSASNRIQLDHEVIYNDDKHDDDDDDDEKGGNEKEQGIGQKFICRPPHLRVCFCFSYFLSFSCTRFVFKK
jgi:hypothetical protein